MMIDESRLLSKLQPDGFELGWVDNVVKEVVFVRSSCVAPAFERVRAYAAGRKGDALLASVGVSMVSGRNATKGLVDTQLLLELAADPSRGWTIVASNEDVLSWEDQLGAIASERAEALALHKGPELVSSTLAARQDAERYADELMRFLENQDHAEWIGTMTPLQREEAIRIAHWPGVLQIPDCTSTYELATHCIVACSERIEGRSYYGHDPLKDRDLMWRIQLLVDLMNRNDYKDLKLDAREMH